MGQFVSASAHLLVRMEWQRQQAAATKAVDASKQPEQVREQNRMVAVVVIVVVVVVLVLVLVLVSHWRRGKREEGKQDGNKLSTNHSSYGAGTSSRGW